MATRKAISAFPLSPWKRQVSAFLHRPPPQTGGPPRFYCYSDLLNSYTICYQEEGDPQEVMFSDLQQVRGQPPMHHVLVKMMTATVNLADLQMAQGNYCVQPNLPAIAGNEGVGVVIATGKGVHKLRLGDWVVPRDYGWGTWRQYAEVDEKSVVKIPDDAVPTALEACQLAMYPCTAYRILKALINLEPGEAIFQNSVLTPVGMSVIQLCKAWDITTINIMRDGPDTERLAAYVRELGGDHVISDAFLMTHEMKYFMQNLKHPPRLTINCTDWNMAGEMEKYLDRHAIMATYGYMSEKTVTDPPHYETLKPHGVRIKQVRGYWQSTWDHGKCPSMKEMVSEISHLVRHGRFVFPPSDIYTLDMFNYAIRRCKEIPVVEPRRVILKLDDELRV